MPSPLAEELTALGGQFAGESPPAAGPNHFGDPIAEYHAARSSAAIIDRSTIGKLELCGPDRAKFLHNLCTNDIKTLAAGRGCEAYFTNAHGKILAQVRVFAGANSHWIDTVPGASGSLLAHLERYHIMEKVNLADRTDEFAHMLLAGPRAGDILVRALGIQTPAVGNLGHAAITFEGTVCDLICHDILALPAFELRVPAEHAVRLWRQIWHAGRPSGLRAMGQTAFEMIRIEAGLPVYGVEISEANLPQELGRLDRTVSFTKGCYLGQETIARIDALGHVNRHLVGLVMHQRREPPPIDASISAGGKPIGNITSACQSPRFECAIALGYVRRGFERAGTEVDVECSGENSPAQVRSLPFQP